MADTLTATHPPGTSAMADAPMRIQRIDQLSEPPVPGRRYLVPCVRGSWFDKVADWPVMGPQHNDLEFFRFQDEHYHLDRRFLTARNALRAIASPLHTNWRINPNHIAAPTWRVRLCRASEFKFPDSAGTIEMQTALAGRQCKRAKSGWICPHQHFPLGSIQPNVDGRIICPLHGMQIDAATGIVPTTYLDTRYSVEDYRYELCGPKPSAPLHRIEGGDRG